MGGSFLALIAAASVYGAECAQLARSGEPPIILAQACCKMCSKGKACGDTCISRDKNCHVGSGCACDR